MRAAEIALDAVESAILALLCVLAAVWAVLGILWDVTVVLLATIFLLICELVCWLLKHMFLLNLLAAFVLGVLANGLFDVPIWQGFIFSLFAIVGFEVMVGLILDKR